MTSRVRHGSARETVIRKQNPRRCVGSVQTLGVQNASRHLIVPAFASWIGIAACAGTPMAPMEYSKPPAKADQASALVPVAEAVQAPPPAPPPPPPVQLVAVARERTMATAPALRVKAPSDGKSTHAVPLLLKLAAHPWLEAHDAERLWVRFDDGGLLEIPATSAPIDLDALLSEHKLPALAPGPHVLRVLATTSVGASIADGTPATIVRFNSGKGTDKTMPVAGPRLTLLATERCYAPNTRIPLDFYTHDVTLSAEGARIHYSLDDASAGDLTAATPWTFENVAVGDHTLVLTFVGADGQPVSAAEPPTRWAFTVAENCAAAAPPAPTAAP
jgi:hypothetical protein